MLNIYLKGIPNSKNPSMSINSNKINMVDLNNKNILVTGGCGFIGSNFLEYLKKHYKNVSIVNVDKWGIGHRKMSTTMACNHIDYEEISFSLCDLNPDSNLFWNGVINKNKFDYVFHFAAESHVDRSISGPEAFVYNNVMGITKLLEMVRVKQPQARVINVSTDEVYGHLGLNSDPFTEETNLNPRSPYSASKAAADLIAKSYVDTYGLDIITTRCCNNFGPNQFDEKLIPTIIKNLVNGKPIPVYGDGTNIREWIYVDDHNKSILELAEIGESGGVYNIGSGKEMTNLEMIADIGKILEIDPIIKFVKDRQGHDFRYAISSINYKRSFELMEHDEAMHRTVTFYASKFSKNG
jgi:dTDP-glucose 4,6-dehydratase